MAGDVAMGIYAVLSCIYFLMLVNCGIEYLIFKHHPFRRSTDDESLNQK